MLVTIHPMKPTNGSMLIGIQEKSDNMEPTITELLLKFLPILNNPMVRGTPPIKYKMVKYRKFVKVINKSREKFGFIIERTPIDKAMFAKDIINYSN
jgi:hypothetical protein